MLLATIAMLLASALSNEPVLMHSGPSALVVEGAAPRATPGPLHGDSRTFAGARTRFPARADCDSPDDPRPPTLRRTTSSARKPGRDSALLKPGARSDSAADNFPDPKYWIRGGNHYPESVLIHRDIVLVAFAPGLSRRQRDSILRLVRGTIVGICGDMYFIRVPGDGTVEPAFRAIARLEKLREVESATPELIDEGTTEGVKH